MLALAAFGFLLHACSAAAPGVSINWLSTPVLNGETVLASGGGFTNSSKIELTSADGTKHVVPGERFVPDPQRFS